MASYFCLETPRLSCRRLLLTVRLFKVLTPREGLLFQELKILF